MTVDELDQLLSERFNLQRADLLAALKTLPAIKPGAASLTEEQLRYAASDVLHLHALRARLDAMLAREGRTELARSCFDFLPARALLDLAGWPEQDIFAH